MVVCQFDGNSDMYGLGIRIGFYLQWFALIFANWMAPKEVPGLRFTYAVFVTATFLALMIQTPRKNLQIVEIYIVLLLTFGFYLFLVPLYLWRLVTGFNTELDPTRHPIVSPSTASNILNHVLVSTVVLYEVWFWFARIPQLGDQNCQQYGFLFAKIRLDNKGFQVINILLYFSLLVIFTCVALKQCAYAINLVAEDPR